MFIPSKLQSYQITTNIETRNLRQRAFFMESNNWLDNIRTCNFAFFVNSEINIVLLCVVYRNITLNIYLDNRLLNIFMPFLCNLSNLNTFYQKLELNKF